MSDVAYDLQAIERFVAVLETSKNTSDRIFSAFPGVFVLFDNNRRIIKANDMANEHFGLDPSGLLGQDLAETTTPMARDAFLENLQTCINGLTRKNEFEIQYKPEQYMLWQVSRFSRTEVDGSLFVGIGIDTTDLKESHSKVMNLEKQLEVSQSLQKHLLPEFDSFENETYELASFYKAAENVGGDVWWFMPRENGELRCGLGDVSGHGLDAAMVTAVATGAFYTMVKTVESIKQDIPTQELLGHLNQSFIRLNRGLHWMALLCLDTRFSENKLNLHFCGFPFVGVFRKGQDKAKTYNARGTPVGVEEHGFTPGFAEAEFLPGDTFFACTDGAFEFLTKGSLKPYKQKRLFTYINSICHLPLQEMRLAIRDEIHNQADPRHLQDDITYILLRHK